MMLVLKETKLKNSFKSKRCVSTSQPLEMLHIDLCGPMRIMSRGGKRYVCVIVDDYSRFTSVSYTHLTLPTNREV